MTRNLLDALITATSEVSLPIITGALQPGDMGVAANGKAFLVTASRSLGRKISYKVAFEDGSEVPLEGEGVMTFEDMGSENSPMEKVSTLTRLAMNPDFDLYVKTSITDHNLPVDEGMSWGKWLEATFRTMVAPTNEEVRDEAIHHMLIENLFRYDALARFDASRLPASIQALPMEKQVSSYLKGYFLQQRSDCVEWIKKTYGTGKEMLVMDDAEGSEAFMNNPDYAEPDSGFEGSIAKMDTEKFRKAFLNFLENGAGLTHKKTKEKVALLLNLILDTPATKPGEIIQRLADQAEVSHSTATKLFFTTLPPLIEKFMKTPEGASLNSANTPSVAKHSNLEDSSMRQSRFKQAEAEKCSQCGQNLVNGICPPCKGKADKTLKETTQALKDQGIPEKTGPQVKSYGSTTASNKAARTEGTPTSWSVDNERVLPSKDGEPEGSKIKIQASVDKYATFRHLAEEEAPAISEALVELSQAFATLAEASEALVENLDLAPISEEGSIKEKVASRKKFASTLKKLAEEAPDKVEDAVKELYSSLDEIAAAMENLASNLGIDLVGEESDLDSEVHDELSDTHDTEEVIEDVDNSVIPEDVNIDGSEAPAILDEFVEEDKSKEAAPRNMKQLRTEDGKTLEYAPGGKVKCPFCNTWKKTQETCTNCGNKEASLRERILARKEARTKTAATVVCNTESGGVWTKYSTGDDVAIMKACEETKWSLCDPKMAAEYLAKGPLYILSEGPESFAVYDPTRDTVYDVDDAKSNFFEDELAELKTCLSQ